MQANMMRSLVLGLAGAALSLNAAAAGLKVEEKAELPVAPDKAWAAIKDFDSWQNWHPAVASTEITKGKGNTKGTVRVLTIKDGAKITEELTAYNDKAMSYSYRILESPLPVEKYASTLKVTKSGSGSTVTWSSHFSAKKGTSDEDAKKAIDGIYTAGLDNLKTMLK